MGRRPKGDDGDGTFEIDSGIAIPPRGSGISRKIFNTLELLPVSDSFLIPCEDDKKQSVVGAVGRQARKLGIKVESRRDEGGVRVWRTE